MATLAPSGTSRTTAPTAAPTRQAALAVADVAIEHDLVVITDEVYEHLVYDGIAHRPLAGFDGMRDRTLAVSSAGKTFSVTGRRTPPAIWIIAG